MTDYAVEPHDLDAQIQRVSAQGWFVAPGVVAPELVDALIAELRAGYEVRRELMVRRGLAEGGEGVASHLLSGETLACMQFLEQRLLHDLLAWFFAGPYILNTFGGFLNLPGASAFPGRPHRDVRTFTLDQRRLINTVVMLDDFRVDNGATYLLSGSHRSADRPPDDDFFAAAERAVAPAGSLLVFDSNLWHASGANGSADPRRALTIMYSKPWFKPQFDYPRSVGYDAEPELSEHLRQVIGYRSRIPASLEEWFQPIERRMYARDQG